MPPLNFGSSVTPKWEQIESISPNQSPLEMLPPTTDTGRPANRANTDSKLPTIRQSASTNKVFDAGDNSSKCSFAENPLPNLSGGTLKISMPDKSLGSSSGKSVTMQNRMSD